MNKTSDIAKAAENSTPSLAGVLANNTDRRGIARRGVCAGGYGGSSGGGHRAEHRRQTQAVHHGRRCRHDHGHDAIARRDRSRSRAAGSGGDRRPVRVSTAATLQGVRVPRPGTKNLITDVAGLSVGHATDEAARTGVTVLLCGAGLGGRRRCPRRRTRRTRNRNAGRRESGGPQPTPSFWRAARYSAWPRPTVSPRSLSSRSIGLHLKHDSLAIPIVPAAVLHDLGQRRRQATGARTPPYRELGIRASNAAGTEFDLGSHGAGRGAMAGLVKGGIGSASLDLGAGLIVGALIALNSVGSVFMPDGKTLWAWAFELDGEFGGASAAGRRHGLERSRARRLAPRGASDGCKRASIPPWVWSRCTADLSTAECKRVAMMAHDGIARAVRPAHTPFDGDTLFAVASGASPLGRHPVARRRARAHRIGGRRLREPRYRSRGASRLSPNPFARNQRINVPTWRPIARRRAAPDGGLRGGLAVRRAGRGGLIRRGDCIRR